LRASLTFWLWLALRHTAQGTGHTSRFCQGADLASLPFFRASLFRSRCFFLCPLIPVSMFMLVMFRRTMESVSEQDDELSAECTRSDLTSCLLSTLLFSPFVQKSRSHCPPCSQSSSPGEFPQARQRTRSLVSLASVAVEVLSRLLALTRGNFVCSCPQACTPQTWSK
jgi:hypothetical protein